jgi:hypothetical protein
VLDIKLNERVSLRDQSNQIRSYTGQLPRVRTHRGEAVGRHTPASGFVFKGGADIVAYAWFKAPRRSQAAGEAAINARASEAISRDPGVAERGRRAGARAR